MENGSKIGLGLIVLVLIAGGFYWVNSNQSSNPTIDVKTDTSIKATTVQVAAFYDGENGYSLSIPSGNNSTCIWNWTGGNAAIPFSETTYANTATEKHILTFGKAPNGEAVSISDVGYNFKVTCLDDFGNQYIGAFPSKS